MYRVLLVEDDRQIREVIGDYFGRRDQIALDFAEDGNIGLAKILNELYDLIVLDIMMPGLDGFELCKIIRKRSSVPVVFLTGRVRVIKHKILESGQIQLDPVRFEVKVAGEVVDLPPKEYQILKYMMEHPGTAVTRKLLLAVAWGDDMFITERVIDNRVKNLRKKLKKEGARIRTLIGVGYRFD